jgi:hypothetical protein
VPLAALAFSASRTTAWLAPLRPRTRLRWGVAAAVPFAVLAALTASLTADAIGASADSALRFGLVWGAGAALVGTLHRLRRTVTYADTYIAPPWDDRVRLVGAALRPLGVLVVVTAAIGAIVWSVQAVRDEVIARVGRSLPVALAENVLYAGEHGINYAALGAGVELRVSYIGEPPAVPLDAAGAIGQFSGSPEYRLFDLADAMSTPLFALLAIALVTAVLAAALYAGIAVAGAARAENAATGAVFGVLVGPIWAIAAWLAVQLQATFFGLPGMASTFLMTLAVGAVGGAVGGALWPRAGRFLLPSSRIRRE